MILNIAISYAIIYLAFTYMILSILYKKELTEENTIVGLFSVIFVAYCFLFANLGFVNIFASVLIQFPYVFLVYAGTKSTLKTIKRYDLDNNIIDLKINNKSTTFVKMTHSYLVITGLFLFVSFCCILISWTLKNNICMMLVHLTIPIYIAISLWNQSQKLREIKVFKLSAIFTSYTFVAFTISLYEFADFLIFIFNTGAYSEFGKIYEDPTHTFDILWILANIVFLLFIPRVKYLSKETK